MRCLYRQHASGYRKSCYASRPAYRLYARDGGLLCCPSQFRVVALSVFFASQMYDPGKSHLEDLCC